MKDIFYPGIEKFETAEGTHKKGTEKAAYTTKSDDSLVILKAEESVNGAETSLTNELTLKGTFYLTKIMHLLFPKNVPDIHRSYYNDPKDPLSYTQVREKVQTGDDHETLINTEGEIRKAHKTWEQIPEHTKTRMKKAERALESSATKLYKQFINCGVSHGDLDSLHNFGIDEEGNTVFTEDFKPFNKFYKDKPARRKFVQFDKLREAIEYNITDEKSKRHALNYLGRLIELYEEAQKGVQK